MSQAVISIAISFLLGLMLLSVFAVIAMRNLFAAIILLSIYSLLAAALFMTLDAVDVAFTEAAVGAGISTILLLATLLHVGQDTKAKRILKPAPLLLVLAVGALLVYGTLDLPEFGNPQNQVHRSEITRHYLEKSPGKTGETGIPNTVTSILASYRGYDTLGEVTVVFCACIGVMLLLGRQRGRRKPVPDSNKHTTDLSS